MQVPAKIRPPTRPLQLQKMTNPSQRLPVISKESSIFDRKSIQAFYDEVREIYLSDQRPWVIGYSDGKDSTATVQLVWLALRTLPLEKRSKKVYVISSDTFVETPVIVDHVTSNLDAINRAARDQQMPFEAHKVVPDIKDTFWINLLGRGYPAPTSRFRWCTERMKIKPADKFILDRVAEFGEVVMVLERGVAKVARETRCLKRMRSKAPNYDGIHPCQMRLFMPLLRSFPRMMCGSTLFR